MAAVFEPIAAKAAPARQVGPWRLARRNLFANPASSVTTLALIALAAWLLPHAFAWLFGNAIWHADEPACQAARGSGACWGAVAEKHRLIVLGRYPYEEQWRPVVATLLLFGLLIISCVRRFWHVWLVPAWAAGLAGFFILMRGNLLGLSLVRTDQWGGLPLTVMLATVSIALAFPIAIAVALGRRSRLPAISSLCIVYIELIRGVPLISVLFMASFMFPLLMPPGTTPDVLLRVLVGITLFNAAYMAEIVRAGLQSVPRGQVEAAATVGLSGWQTQRLVVLPQALTAVVPSLMNNFIAIFKDTSLITIVSLYELTGSLGLALNGDPLWRPYLMEGYLFICLIYFIVCFSMSRYSLWVEKQLARGKAR
ncbi:MAG: amino acid ABC transporter permease [Burkholderiales bacterium]|nr:amino acid ABC transporter permease [Burkholderiales bacterium]